MMFIHHYPSKSELRYLTDGPNADKCKSSQQKVGAVLVEVCSKCEQYRCENACESSEVFIQYLSKALKLRIFSAGGHLDWKTGNAPLQLGVWRRATAGNNSRELSRVLGV